MKANSRKNCFLFPFVTHLPINVILPKLFPLNFWCCFQRSSCARILLDVSATLMYSVISNVMRVIRRDQRGIFFGKCVKIGGWKHPREGFRKPSGQTTTVDYYGSTTAYAREFSCWVWQKGFLSLLKNPLAVSLQPPSPATALRWCTFCLKCHSWWH